MSTLFAVAPTELAPVLSRADKAAADLLTMLTPKYLDRISADGLLAIRERLESALGAKARQFSMFTGAANAAPVVDVVSGAVDASEGIASVLSPSQVKAFTDCQLKWYYKHVLKLPEVRNSALGLGSAFHTAVAYNLSQKVESKMDLPTAEVVSSFRQAWAEELETIQLAEGESAEELRAMGSVMVDQYMGQVAPLVQPAAVETRVEGVIGGVRVQGKVDVIDVNGTICDAKTASKKPAGVMSDYLFQISTYAQLHPASNGKARLDTVTKTKTINVVQQTVEIGDADRTHTARVYPLVQEAMRSGLYTLNRNSMLCSRKYCPFATRCQEEYGGRVD